MKQVRLFALLACLAVSGPTPSQPLALQTLVLEHQSDRWSLAVPAKLRLELLTTALDRPRLMHFMPNGDLLIGSGSGNVYRLPPPYREPEVLVRLSGYPHSVAYRKGELLIARTDGLYAAPYQPGQTRIAADTVRLVAALPGGGGHSSRTVAIGPDKRVYIALGISGNCDDEFIGTGYPFARQRGGVLVLDESGDTPQLKPFASGLRNPVGMDWHPVTGELYASNNGPDHLGFDQPPEYFARLTAGSFHGMPWYRFDGERILRDTCIDSEPPLPLSAVRKPVATFPARNAPMGVAFVPAGALDERFTDNAIVALRGSWGTRPDGGFRGDPATRRPPRLMMVQFDKGRATAVVDVVRGFQRPDGKRLARPVGVATGPDGALYFTSDSGLQGLFRLSAGDPDKP
jgi:glucose/arabinose dehydrogenase